MVEPVGTYVVKDSIAHLRDVEDLVTNALIAATADTRCEEERWAAHGVVAALYRAGRLLVEGEVKVWAVVVGNYEPPEVVGLYTVEEAARTHAQENVGDLRVVPWMVASRYTGDET